MKMYCCIYYISECGGDTTEAQIHHSRDDILPAQALLVLPPGISDDYINLYVAAGRVNKDSRNE